MTKPRDKMFVVRKYIKAPNAAAAIRKDKTTPVDDVWIDENWQKKDLPGAIGFSVETGDDDD